MSREYNLLASLLLGNLNEPPHRSCAFDGPMRSGRDRGLFGDPFRRTIGSNADHAISDWAVDLRDQSAGLTRAYTRCDLQQPSFNHGHTTRPAAALEGISQAYQVYIDQSKQQWAAAMLRSPFQFDFITKHQTLNVLELKSAMGDRWDNTKSCQSFQQDTKLQSYGGVGLVWLTQSNTTSRAVEKCPHSEEL